MTHTSLKLIQVAVISNSYLADKQLCYSKGVRVSYTSKNKERVLKELKHIQDILRVYASVQTEREDNMSLMHFLLKLK